MLKRRLSNAGILAENILLPLLRSQLYARAYQFVVYTHSSTIHAQYFVLNYKNLLRLTKNMCGSGLHCREYFMFASFRCINRVLNIFSNNSILCIYCFDVKHFLNASLTSE